MRIAFFSDVCPPKIDGIVTHVIETAAALKKRGHTLLAVVPRHRGARRHLAPDSPFAEIISLPSVPALVYPEIRLGLPSLALLRLRRFRPEVIHVHTPGTVGIAAIAAAKLLRVPLVATFHTYVMSKEYLDLIRLGRFEKKLSRLIWGFNNYYLNHSDVVISPAESVKLDLIKSGVRKKVYVIHNGVDLDDFAPGGEFLARKAREKYGLGDKVILYVGRISKEKSLDVLIKAFGQLVKEVPDVQLLLVGDGPEWRKLESLTEKEGLTGRVIFAGKIAHDILAASGVYEASSIFATSSAAENQPISVVEALAKGLPVVGVRARGLPELVLGNGLLAEPADPRSLAGAMKKLLTDNNLRQAFSQKSKDKAEAYSISNTALQIENLYRSLV